MTTFAKSAVLWGIGVALLVSAAHAQDVFDAGTAKPVRVNGVLEKIDDKSITVKNEKGVVQTFMITSQSRFGTKAEPKKASDFKVGDAVMVAVVKGEKGVFEVRGIYPRKPKPAKDAPASSPAADKEQKAH